MNRPRGIVFVLSTGSSEEGFVFFLQWRVLPFPLRFQEECEGVSTLQV